MADCGQYHLNPLKGQHAGGRIGAPLAYLTQHQAGAGRFETSHQPRQNFDAYDLSLPWNASTQALQSSVHEWPLPDTQGTGCFHPPVVHAVEPQPLAADMVSPYEELRTVIRHVFLYIGDGRLDHASQLLLEVSERLLTSVEDLGESSSFLLESTS